MNLYNSKFSVLQGPLFLPLEQGVLTGLWALTSEEGAGLNGKVRCSLGLTPIFVLIVCSTSSPLLESENPIV